MFYEIANVGGLLAMNDRVASGGALSVFVVYVLAVLFIAWLSNRTASSREFLSEYFLGSRSLGMWAFALTFAATSASGGTFIGFPSIVYSSGWVVALWIGGYMIVPIVALGLMGKRLNHVARLGESITLPDVVRDRFESPLLGTVSTVLIVFFMVFNLIAQFKSGAVILQTLLESEPAFHAVSDWFGAQIRDVSLLGDAAGKPSYLLCLMMFAFVVIIYTAYGGFRAVVWTDVMQGLVMVAGVLFLLPLTIWAVGGLDKATREMAEMTPPHHVRLRIQVAQSPTESSVVIPNNSWLIQESNGVRQVFRTKLRCEIPLGSSLAQCLLANESTNEIPAIELTYDKHIESQAATKLSQPVHIEVVDRVPYKFGANQPGVYVTAPGPDPEKIDGFLPINLAISFFLMWTFSTAGQPSGMVRLMAFNNTQTFRRAIFTVSIYFSLIYFPIVVIFCCARVLLPGWETEPDRIMPEMAQATSTLAGMPWLAGLLLAAPFAAVMSTMDSFLLMISSSVVRDIYQRNFNPDVSETNIKRITYATTFIVGFCGMILAINPSRLLQDIIIFTTTGLSTTFLVAVFLALYWPRFNLPGVLSAIFAGFGSHVALYLFGTLSHPAYKITPFEPGGVHPFVLGTAISLVVSVGVTLLTGPPPTSLVRKYFGRPKPHK
ncbi:MAG: hypothetical protein JNL67_23275 [Planctomycetaceae bacterium]|nr:hypothetical protein [Planctomycetaceae bacterium]